MASPDRTWANPVRIHVLILCSVLALVVLGLILWRMQVRNVSQYLHRVDRQSVRRVRLPAPRGRIFDRRGVCLADNRPSYCIAFYVEEMRKPGRWDNTIDEVERVADRMSSLLGLRREITREDIRRHIQRRLPMALLAWSEISPEALARFKESDETFPGVDVYVEPIRVYPQGGLAAHVLGYVGRAEPERDGEEPYHFYLPEMEGKSGIERFLNTDLAGAAGGRLIRVDASGFKYGEIAERPSFRGRDVTLSIDIRIQRLAEAAILEQRGAVVVIDPRNGDLLAMASSPSFDPNLFSPRLIGSDFRRLRDDPGRPFFNRAIAGVYAPGSIFKPVVAIAALENRRATGATIYECPGFFDLGSTRFHCWSRIGHGAIGMRKAIEQSCNAYFCHLGVDIGYERIYHMGEALGLGRPTGVELYGEESGLLPDQVWKRRVMRDSWRPGDTCNLSIGQGFLSVTPIQMAAYCAALANGGRLYRPRLVLERGVVRDLPGRPISRGDRSWAVPRLPGELSNALGWSSTTLDTVRGGMHDVVEAETGTGKRAHIDGVVMGGKTGTAEFGPRGQRTKFGWMLLFAPFDQPRYAVAMVLEDAVSGGITIAPRIRELMQNILETERNPSPGGGAESEVSG